MGTLNNIKAVFDGWNSTGISFISNENKAVGINVYRDGFWVGRNQE